LNMSMVWLLNAAAGIAAIACGQSICCDDPLGEADGGPAGGLRRRRFCGLLGAPLPPLPLPLLPSRRRFASRASSSSNRDEEGCICTATPAQMNARKGGARTHERRAPPGALSSAAPRAEGTVVSHGRQTKRMSVDSALWGVGRVAGWCWVVAPSRRRAGNESSLRGEVTTRLPAARIEQQQQITYLN
jgi:hypothetical protein